MPAVIVNAFKTQFMCVKSASWEKEGNQYEAEFEQSQKKQFASFDATGNLLELETEKAVQQAVAKAYPAGK